MEQPVDIETIKAEAFRKLGRNIVNLSKIEAGFKHLLAISSAISSAISQLGQLAGANEKILSEQLLKNKERFEKQTLGTLVGAFNQDVLTVHPSEPTLDPETRIAFSFKLVCNDSDYLKQQKRKLREMVTERNRLIHQDLALLNSVEDYRKLADFLDEQNPRLLAQLDELRWIFESLERLGKAWEELSQSKDFSGF